VIGFFIGTLPGGSQANFVTVALIKGDGLTDRNMIRSVPLRRCQNIDLYQSDLFNLGQPR